MTRKAQAFRDAKGFQHGNLVQFAARLDADDFNLLRDVAKQRDISVSGALRAVVKAWAAQRRTKMTADKDAGK